MALSSSASVLRSLSAKWEKSELLGADAGVVSFEEDGGMLL